MYENFLVNYYFKKYLIFHIYEIFYKILLIKLRTLFIFYLIFKIISKKTIFFKIVKIKIT